MRNAHQHRFVWKCFQKKEIHSDHSSRITTARFGMGGRSKHFLSAVSQQQDMGQADTRKDRRNTIVLLRASRVKTWIGENKSFS